MIRESLRASFRERLLVAHFVAAAARPLANLPDDQNAKEKFVIVRSSIPGGNSGMAAPTLPDLGYYVRIDQVHLKSTIGVVSRERRISTPSNGADASRALKVFPPERKRRYSSAGTSTATGFP
jgi:hypothetical protein